MWTRAMLRMVQPKCWLWAAWCHLGCHSRMEWAAGGCMQLLMSHVAIPETARRSEARRASDPYFKSV